MIGVPVADEHRVDLVRGDPFQQPRHGREASVDQQRESVVLHEVAAAGLARFRPRAAPAQNRDPHLHDSSQSAR